MSRRILPRNTWIWVLLAASLAGNSHAQLPTPRGKVITWQSPSATTEACVGILGEVRQPGVYKLEPAALSVQTLVKRAGGLTNEATQTIRLIRQDRVAQNLFFSPQFDCPLLPNDLLVVESKRAQAAATSQLIDADPRLKAVQQAAATTEETEVVQVAFLNVLDRPVIVKVKHENARVDHLVQMLDQPIELVRGVRVLSADRLSGSPATPAQVLSTLTNGSVLVFPKNAVNQLKLPPLPIPFQSEIAAGAFPSLIGGPSGQSPELHNVGSLAPLIARDSNSNPGVLPHSAYEHAASPIPVPPPRSAMPTVPAIPAESSPSDAGPQMPIVSSPPRIARNLPFSGDARIRSSSTRTISDGDSSGINSSPSHPNGSPSDAGASKSPSNPVPQAGQDAAIEDMAEFEDPTAVEGRSPFSFGQMLGLLACVGGLIGCALLVRRHLDRTTETRPQTATESQPESQASPESMSERHEPSLREQAVSPLPNEGPNEVERLAPSIASSDFTPSPTAAPATSVASAATISAAPQLERLIRNELPMREEAVAFPTEIVLQGRIAPRPIYRVDTATTQAMGHGPHFSIESTDTPIQNASAAAIVTDQLDHSHSSKPARPHFLGNRATEKTVAATMTASVSEPHDAPSRTPVSDALRQLQGGQS
jgi:SLBB domain